MGLLFAIIALSLLIFFHELGHFLFAKFFGVKVETFSIGFGKKLFSFTYKDTQYAISAIPLGGYVKLKGENKTDSKNEDNIQDLNKDSLKDSLFDKHPLERIAIYFAGPLFNFIIAFIMYCFVFSNGVHSYSQNAIVGSIGDEYGAYGILKKNDEIISINGKMVSKFSDISNILNDSNNRLEKEAKITILRQHNTESIKQKIEVNVPLTYKYNKVLLGIAPIEQIYYLGALDIIDNAYRTTLENIVMIFYGLRDLILGVIGIDNISSVIGIADVSSKVYNVSFVSFVGVIALISINLGIINLLPLPMLDGGQIIFSLYEWITNKSINQKVSNILVAVGFSFIITLMLIGTYNDIMRLTSS